VLPSTIFFFSGLRMPSPPLRALMFKGTGIFTTDHRLGDGTGDHPIARRSKPLSHSRGTSKQTTHRHNVKLEDAPIEEVLNFLAKTFGPVGSFLVDRQELARLSQFCRGI
jgi:hypothetical protein